MSRLQAIPAVHLFLLKSNKILLSRRQNSGFHDGDYSVPAGHLEENETFLEALVREVKEEIGIDFDSNHLDFTHVMHRKGTDFPRVDFFFSLKEWRGEPKIMEPHKCDDLGWFEFSKLPDNMVPYVRQAIKLLSEKISYSEHNWK
ncbi:MAG: NUDIX domain-containing protein [archaeon]